MNPSESKFGLQGDYSSNLRNFAAELRRSRQQAEMASRLLGGLIQYHQYFCDESAKSFERLHKQLREIYPAACEDLVSFIVNIGLVCRSSTEPIIN